MHLNFNMSHFLVTLFLLCVALVIPHPISAVPVPTLNLKALIEKSDLIVIGEVQVVTQGKRIAFEWQGRTTSGTLMQALFKVDRTLAGSNRNVSLTFDFFYPDEFLGFAGISASHFGMYFLKKGQSGSWAIADPYFPSIVASRKALPMVETGSQRIARELALVFKSSTSSSVDKVAAVSAIDTLDAPIVKKLLLEAFPTSEIKTRARIAAALLKRNESSALDFAVKLILAPPSTLNKDDIGQLAYSIEVGVSDPNAIPHLIQLSKSAEPKVRQAVAVSLRASQSRDAIRPLVAFLSDSNREVRYLAVLGLSQITGQSNWGPAIDVFARDESRFINYWKDWAKTN